MSLPRPLIPLPRLYSIEASSSTILSSNIGSSALISNGGVSPNGIEGGGRNASSGLAVGVGNVGFAVRLANPMGGAGLGVGALIGRTLGRSVIIGGLQRPPSQWLLQQSSLKVQIASKSRQNIAVNSWGTTLETRWTDRVLSSFPSPQD